MEFYKLIMRIIIEMDFLNCFNEEFLFLGIMVIEFSKRVFLIISIGIGNIELVRGFIL